MICSIWPGATAEGGVGVPGSTGVRHWVSARRRTGTITRRARRDIGEKIARIRWIASGGAGLLQRANGKVRFGEFACGLAWRGYSDFTEKLIMVIIVNSL